MLRPCFTILGERLRVVLICLTYALNDLTGFAPPSRVDRCGPYLVDFRKSEVRAERNAPRDQHLFDETVADDLIELMLDLPT